MIRLRFPTVPASVTPRPALPQALRWDAPPVTAAALLSRRQFLAAAGVVLAAAALPWTGVRRAVAAARGRFFTGHERRTLGALCDRIIPPDGDPGGAALGAARYIEGLLTALDRSRRRVYAGGPYSGRQPFGDPRDGTPSRRRPRNAFRRFLPLSRLQEIAWRAELFGSAGVPEMAAIDASLGSVKEGLRDKYRAALAKVDQVSRATSGARFVDLDPAGQDVVLLLLDQGAFAPDPRRNGDTWPTLLVRHTLEGCFGPPEYGGNRKGAGWRTIGYEGDSQPLGYAIYSAAIDDYVERPDHPLSTPDPDEIGPGGTIVPNPLPPDAQRIQSSILTLTAPFGGGGLC